MSLTRGIVLQPENSIDVEPGAVTLIDQSRYRNHGTITGATWVQLPSGLWVLLFDGVSNSVNCGNDSSFDITSAVTLEVWLYQTGRDNYDGIIAKSSGSGLATLTYALIVPNNANISFLIGDGSGFQSIDLAEEYNKWLHIVGVLDADFLRIYKNGVSAVTPAARTRTPGTNANDLYVGRWQGQADTFIGNIALARIYNRALSAGEILNHYEKTKHWFGVHE